MKLRFKLRFRNSAREFPFARRAYAAKTIATAVVDSSGCAGDLGGQENVRLFGGTRKGQRKRLRLSRESGPRKNDCPCVESAARRNCVCAAERIYQRRESLEPDGGVRHCASEERGPNSQRAAIRASERSEGNVRWTAAQHGRTNVYARRVSAGFEGF